MIVIVAGGRDFADYGLLRDKLDHLLVNQTAPVIMSGNARGADALGERYAREKGYGLVIRPANWKANGRRAGFVRNEAMAAEADALVAFWDGSSHGTQHMIETMRAAGKPVRVVRY